MKVVGARLLQYKVPFRQPYQTARGLASYREGVIVELMTSAGVAGLGESAPLPDEAIDVEAFAQAVGDAASSAMGWSLADITNGRWDTPRPSSAGIEVAAWDALARSQGLGVAHLLSQTPTIFVDINALLSARPLDGLREAARAARAAAYSTVKLKAGMEQTTEAEVERVAAVRDAIGAEVKLRLDANGAWGSGQAVEILKALEAYEIEYVEQPVAPGALEVLKAVRDSVSIPIAADEDVTGFEAAIRLIDEGCADVLVLKPLQLGGIGPTQRIVEAAQAKGVKVVITTSIDTGVGTAAALHLAAALGDGAASGLGTLPLLDASLVRPDLAIEHGRMALPGNPGLGVELYQPEIERYTVRRWTVGAS
jgi:o-succinylbenzoate synthase